jgi:diaminopimelate decarboxylase
VNHFEVKAGALHCEGVPLEQIARDVGTPTYVYSTATLTRHLRDHGSQNGAIGTGDQTKVGWVE